MGASLESAGLTKLHMRKFCCRGKDQPPLTDEEKKERDAALLTLAMTAKEFAAIQPIYSAVSAKGFKFFFDRMKSVTNRSDWALFQGPYELCAFDCCSLVDAWAIRIRLKPENTPIRIVFGRGNRNRHWLELGYKAEYSKKPDTHLSPEPLFEDDT